MSNIGNDLDFRDKIKSFSPESQFLAEQIYEIQKKCPACNGSISTRKTWGFAGFGALVGGAVAGVIDYFVTRKG